MITSINEFFFSKHYAYDSDNRFSLRIRNAVILNKLDDPQKAEYRFRKAMYHYGLNILDKTATAISPIAITFGNLYFRQGGRLIQAEIQIDKSVGNVYVALVVNQTVVTLLLYPFSFSNRDIYNKILAHDAKELKQLRDIDMNVLSFDDRKRKNTIIDLDITDIEFAKLYPAVNLKNNPDTMLTPAEKELNAEENKNQPKAAIYSPTAIPMELKKLVPNKEFVIYDGMEILVNYPEGPKKKKIRRLVIDEKGSSRKFSLEFENTLKPMELKPGDRFIISPKIANEEYKQLIDAFNLEDGAEFHFMGPIVKFNFYSKEKTKSIPKLGIIIEPRTYF